LAGCEISFEIQALKGEMYSALRPLLFRLDPERAHALSLALIRLAGKLPPVGALLRALYAAPQRPVEACGLRFSNPVGLAAGYDKDGLGWRGLACLGFGHLEIGTVTPRPQAGNPRPRLFRLAEEGALINRMGFPGRGAGFVARQLRGPRPAGLVVGVNLGMNKDTPLEAAAGDYRVLMGVFAPLADYLAINVSSPNTAGLRRLQARQELKGLLHAVGEERLQLQSRLSRRVPILVKLAPDLSAVELEDAVDVIMSAGMDGIIATNTTSARPGVRSPRAVEAGGLSGAPLRSGSTEAVQKIACRTGGRLAVIGVGGISDAASAREKLEAGASLIQVYTGLVYRGPGLVKEILEGLGPVLRD
jgi:dihydroorotate dehydrogenase